MGILDNVLGNVKSNLEYKTETGLTSTIVKSAENMASKGKPNPNACPKCKKAAPDPRPKFCPNCGAALMVTCKKCNASYPLGTAFCPEDGTKLG